MGSRTLQPSDPEAKPYEDLRKEIEEHDRRVKAARKAKVKTMAIDVQRDGVVTYEYEEQR